MIIMVDGNVGKETEFVSIRQQFIKDAFELLTIA